MNASELSYRRSAAQGASGFGLLIALYDTLAGDLRRAADAQRSKDLEARAKELKHALLVLAHLEDRVDRESEGVLARKLAAFYANLRHILIGAQIRQSAELLEQQMALVLSIRGTWQELELRTASTRDEVTAAVTPGYVGAVPVPVQPAVSSWSA